MSRGKMRRLGGSCLKTMTQDKDIFKPNIWVILGSTLIILFFCIILILAILYTDRKFVISDYCTFIVFGSFLLIGLYRLLDIWIIKVDKGLILVRRIWKTEWLEIRTTTFKKIKFKIWLDGAFEWSKRLTIYFDNGKRINFYSYTITNDNSLFLALLNQTPDLLNNYKERLKYYEEKKNRWIKNSTWVIIVCILIYITVRFFK